MPADSNVFDTAGQRSYWDDRYADGRTGWDVGRPAEPLRAYLEQLTDPTLRILIPGAGHAYEAEYAWGRGLRNVHVLDVAPRPLAAFAARVPDFPAEQLIRDNFFTHDGQYDLILEQTFFCSFPPTPEFRHAYFRRAHELLAPGGKLVGLWFATTDVGQPGQRPFGGTRAEYLTYLAPYFTVRTLEPASNSIAPRAGTELFGILLRRDAAPRP